MYVKLLWHLTTLVVGACLQPYLSEETFFFEGINHVFCPYNQASRLVRHLQTYSTDLQYYHDLIFDLLITCHTLLVAE